MSLIKKVNVNMGCGSNIVKGWINIDKYLGTNDLDFKEGDIFNIPLKNESVDYLLCDQVMEHLPMAKIVDALYEIRRVLKKGGRAVLVVPDFKDAAEEWLRYNHNEGYNPMLYHHVSEVVYGNQLHDGEFHKTPFSAGFFNHVLHIAGFTDFKLINYPRHGEIPNYPGIFPYSKESRLRNAQLVADITK